MKNKFAWFSLISLMVSFILFFISAIFLKIPEGSHNVTFMVLITIMLTIIMLIFVLLGIILIIISLVKKENLWVSIPIIILSGLVTYFFAFISWR